MIEVSPVTLYLFNVRQSNIALFQRIAIKAGGFQDDGVTRNAFNRGYYGINKFFQLQFDDTAGFRADNDVF